MLVAVVGGVVAGSVTKTERAWPFAPMTMFAFSVDTDGVVHSLGLEATTVDGSHVVVPLGDGGVGLQRAEIEGQREGIEAHPKRLQAIAVAQSRTHPDDPRYARVRMVDTVSTLRDGHVVGEKRVILARWKVIRPHDPKVLS